MNEIRKVCILKNDAEIPLAVGIMDENRQMLAYSMLYHLGENGAQISINGTDVSFGKNDLRLVSEYGVTGRHYTKPHLDPEWYGANGQNFIKEDPLTVSVLADDGPVSIMPFTGCPDKAYEEMHFLEYGFSPQVSLSMPGKDGPINIIENGKAVNLAVTDFSGKVREQEFSNDWAKLSSLQEDKSWAQNEGSVFTYDLACEPKYRLIREESQQISGMSQDEFWKNEQTNGFTNAKRTVYRIQALRDFGDVKAGELGGYVESEDNLSHSGRCWVYGNAVACCDAVVTDNGTLMNTAVAGQSAIISGAAAISGNAVVKGRAKASDHAIVIGRDDLHPPVLDGDARVLGNAQIYGDVTVAGNAVVRGQAKVMGVAPGEPFKGDDRPDPRFRLAYLDDHAVVDGNALVVNGQLFNHAHVCRNAAIVCSPFDGSATIKGNAEIGDNARVLDAATISGEAKIGGDAEIKKKLKIGHDAFIMSSEDILQRGDITAYRNQNDGVTVAYKRSFYDGIEAFKIAKGDHLDENGRRDLYKIEDHFGYFDAADFENAVAEIGTENPEMGQ